MTSVCTEGLLLGRVFTALVEACSVTVLLTVSVMIVVTGGEGDITLSIVSVRGSMRLLIADIASISSCVSGMRSENAAFKYDDPNNYLTLVI